jgi:D-amino-acid dehydrogenase
MSRFDVAIVGGGVVGVSCAYFLAERGARVALLERGEICSGASYGNAGWIFPSHSQPLPAPGVVRQGLRWLLDPESPFYVKPRLDLALARWLLGFWRASSAARAHRAFALKRELSLRSLAYYEKLCALPAMDCGLQRAGLLMACAERSTLEQLGREVRTLRELGGEAVELGSDGLRERAPALSPELAGGFYFPVDAHVEPAAFVTGLAEQAGARGAQILPGMELIALERDGPRIARIVATRAELEADEVVLAAGAWLPGLARPLGLRVPIEAAKGYSLTYRRPPGFGDTAVMLTEARIGVSPTRDELRFAGTLELAGLDLGISPRRVEAIRRGALRFFPELPPLDRVETWRGLRPCTPDDLPVIGRTRTIPNLSLAGGHGMSGLAQGPITGALIAQLLCGERPELDLAPFSPDRFGAGRFGRPAAAVV